MKPPRLTASSLPGRVRLLGILLVLALILIAIWAGWSRRGGEVVGAKILGVRAPESAEGFARAAPGTPIQLPADHGPHPRFQTEWWYFTGNLADETGGRWGYQFTLFRRALQPQMPERASAWASNQVYLAHFALTDVAGDRHQAWERLARGGAGLAGAQAPPLRLWLENWQVRQEGQDRFRLQAQAGDYTLDLALTAAKPAVLQGDEGYSRKGEEAGNASYYYSYTRLHSQGLIGHKDRSIAVTGSSWMDHEWSTSALDEGQIGWDWFSVQLDDGWDLMLFQLRRSDGSLDPHAGGTLIDPQGNTRSLTGEDFRIEAQDRWRSRATGAVYPSGWVITILDQALELTLSPLVLDQEMRLSTRYWEGAAAAAGRHRGRAVAGFGYVELTGYSESMEGRF